MAKITEITKFVWY